MDACFGLRIGLQTKPPRKPSFDLPFQSDRLFEVTLDDIIKGVTGGEEYLSATIKEREGRSLVASMGHPPHPIKNVFVVLGLQRREIDLSSLPREVPSNLSLVSLGLASPVSQTKTPSP